MYEQEEPALRRVLLIVLWFVVIVVILWALIWLIFFRNSGSTKTPQISKQTGQSQQKLKTPNGSSSTASASSASSGGTSSSSTPAGTTPSSAATGSTATGPSTLTNTGAGDIFLPFMVATLAGATFYHIHLRKKQAR
jgi:cytoskeletal protein RodZ